MFEEMMRQIRASVSRIISFIEIKTDVPENTKVIPQSEDECLENSESKKYQEMLDVLQLERNIKIVVVN